MWLSRKDGGTWHFSNPDYCGWARTFDERDTFDETVHVWSPASVGEFCST